MELYTSLTRLKQAMNNGQLPPMTPLAEEAKKIIDPALTIAGDGAGGLVASVSGLQCPIRGCGKWFHDLGRHIATTHRSIGVPAFREAMGIPSTAKLISETLRELKRNGMAARGRLLTNAKRFKAGRQQRATTLRRARTTRANSAMMGSKNLRDVCVAQLAHKLTDLAHTLGRSPSASEARKLLGSTLVDHIIQTFGTWNAAKGHCGLLTQKPGGGSHRTAENRAWVLDTLYGWSLAHGGDLPSEHDAMFSNTTPMLAPPNVIYAVFQTSDWDTCMRRAASHLVIYGGRYGLPHPKPEAVAV